MKINFILLRSMTLNNIRNKERINTEIESTFTVGFSSTVSALSWLLIAYQTALASIARYPNKEKRYRILKKQFFFYSILKRQPLTIKTD